MDRVATSRDLWERWVATEYMIGKYVHLLRLYVSPGIKEFLHEVLEKKNMLDSISRLPAALTSNKSTSSFGVT